MEHKYPHFCIPGSYEAKIRSIYSFEEILRRLRMLGGVYDSDFSGLDAWEQYMVWEIIPGKYEKQLMSNINDSVNAMSNGPHKFSANSVKIVDKLSIIDQFATFTSKTPRQELAILLSNVFKEWPSKPGHWLYISQNWTPKTILSCLREIIKIEQNCMQNIKNPAAYFTRIIQFRKKRAEIWRFDKRI